jgi:hypothetical protein
MWAKLLDYASRKFVLAVLSLGGGFYVTLTKEPESVYAMATLIGVILAFYNGANVAQVFAARGGKYNPPTETTKQEN